VLAAMASARRRYILAPLRSKTVMQLTTDKKNSLGPVRRFLRILMLLNSACSVSGLLDWHGPPQGALRAIDCIREFSEVDYTPDPHKFDVAN
jgi:hypothetical protein